MSTSVSDQRSTNGQRPATADAGVVYQVGGPVVVARGLRHVRLHDVVRVGRLGLAGEVIRLDRDDTVVQVYEETTGLQLGEPVEPSGSGLTVELGPGLLGAILDGTGRPLGRLAEQTGAFIKPGAEADTLEPTARWPFTPAVRVGDLVEGHRLERHDLRHPREVGHGLGSRW